MVVAVTGSRGFLGHHLVKSLKKRRIKVIEIDVSLGIDIISLSDLEKLPPFNLLIHLAAKTYVPDSYTKSLEFFHTNVSGTINCLEICKRNKANIIFTSTYVYGKPHYLPVDESHPTSLWNPYAASKIIGEQLCTSYSQDFEVDACILRIFNMYGPGQNNRFLIPKIINGILKGELSLENSSSKRDYIYVLDVVKAIERCLSIKHQGVCTYNVGSGTSHSVSEVVNIVKNTLRADMNVTYQNLERQSDVPNVVAEISKIKRELGWFPRFDIERGIQHSLRLWKDYGKV